MAKTKETGKTPITTTNNYAGFLEATHIGCVIRCINNCARNGYQYTVSIGSKYVVLGVNKRYRQIKIVDDDGRAGWWNVYIEPAWEVVE